MPHPAGQHHTVDRPDRVQWRAANLDLSAFVTGFVVQDPFMESMQDDLRYYGSLTENQTAAVRRRMEGSAAAPAAPVQQDATTDDATHILNGIYTVNDGTQHLTYRIHSVQRGPLAGKRIVKIQGQYGEFSGFAFLTAQGGIKVWRRFADDDNRNERYIVWAHMLMSALHYGGLGIGNVDSLTHSDGDVRLEIQVARTCRRCNRTLTTPSSIDAGLGPECAARTSDRTEAARRHEPLLDVPAPVATPAPTPTLADLQAAVDATGEATVPAAPVDPDAALSEAEILRILPRLGAYFEGPQRERFNRLYQRVGYYQSRTTCSACGRSDFTSSRGLANHRNNYCDAVRGLNEVRTRAQRQRQMEADRVRAQAIIERGPNPSALGTRFAGEVWAQ